MILNCVLKVLAASGSSQLNPDRISEQLNSGSFRSDFQNWVYIDLYSILKNKLSRKEMLQVITSHYYPRLYYGSEVWYHPLKKIHKDRLKPLHYYPLRLAVGFNDSNKSKSNREISVLCKRASPFEINNYRL